MKELFAIFGLIFILLILMAAHERDMARNCADYGDAKAWFTEIKCHAQ